MTRQGFVDFLNELLAIDPAFAASVMMTRHDCNQVVAEHPHIQVGKGLADQYQTSALGLINGYFQSLDPSQEFIAAVMHHDDDNRILKEFMILVPLSGEE